MTKDGIAKIAEKHNTSQLGAGRKNATHGSEHVDKCLVDDLAAKMVELGQIMTSTKSAAEDKKAFKQAIKELQKPLIMLAWLLQQADMGGVEAIVVAGSEAINICAVLGAVALSKAPLDALTLMHTWWLKGNQQRKCSHCTSGKHT